MSSSNPINLFNLDGRYATPSSVSSAISSQASTDASTYATQTALSAKANAGAQQPALSIAAWSSTATYVKGQFAISATGAFTSGVSSLMQANGALAAGATVNTTNWTQVADINLAVGTTSGTVAAGNDSRLTASATNTAAIAALSLNPTAVKTAAYTAAAQDLVLCNAATVGAFTVTLPTTPTDGTLVEVKKLDSGTNAITVSTGGSDTFSIGGTTTVLALQGQAVTWRYQASSTSWVAISNDLPLSSTDTRYAQLASPTFTGVATAPILQVSGSTGAPNAGRFVGVTALVAPTSGTYVIGDYIVTQSGNMWVCTAAGTPGTWVQPGASTYAATTNVQSFTTSGTWTMPTNAKNVTVYLISGGGGGGSGRRDSTTTNAAYGGGGGAGSARSMVIFPASVLPSSVSVTVGSGGNGGLATSSDTTDGTVGTGGTASVFGGYFAANGGLGGGAGTASSGSAGAAGYGNLASGAGGGASSISATAGTGGQSQGSGSGGGGGGGLSSSNTAYAGGNGAIPTDAYGLSIPAGGAVGSNGNSGANRTPANTLMGGVSGSGGGASTIGAGGSGGNGGLYGAGGGGGGASRTGSSGAGGNGANGIVIVVTSF